MARLARWLLKLVPGLVVVGIMGGLVFYAIRGEQAAREHQAAVERAAETARATLLARGRLGEMLNLCRGGWSNLNFGQEPVGLAWTRQGVSAFFLQGSDQNSLRLLRCDARGVSRGPRVSYPLHEQLPAEAPPKSEQEASQPEWARAVAAASSRPLEASELGFELLLHPVTGRVLSRRWRAGAGGATATVEPADAPAFALLLEPGQLQPAAGSAAPPLQPLQRRTWTVDTESAFAFLAKAMPKGARISELKLEPDEIDLRIQYPTPGVDGDPKAPYGDKTFDEYGIADSDWWYPRNEASFGCAAGVPLESVHAQFLAAHATGARLAWAWFSCSPAYSDGRNGTWHLVPAGPG